MQSFPASVGEIAEQDRLQSHRYVTFARSITVSLTHTCHNRCGYCGFRVVGDGVLLLAEGVDAMRRGVKQGCRELLIMSGERPWLEDGFPLDEAGFIAHVREFCLAAMRLGLLPHSNMGILTLDELRLLKDVNASMGLMLETANDNLEAHRGPVGKRVEERIAHIENAGKLRIPFTTGILVGIGESRDDRREALKVIKSLADRYGHIQEVIVQNFKPKPGTTMQDWPEVSFEEVAEAVGWAHEQLPGVSIQVPPNLNADVVPLLDQGARDLGGISLEIDHVNPECQWPPVERLGASLASYGYYLQERLPVYPEVDADIFAAADTLRRELVGDVVTYVVNCNVNFTNICVANCLFCGFCRKHTDADAYVFSMDTVFEKLERAIGLGATETCMQGGLNPHLDLDFYTNLLRAIKQRFPALHIHAFSPMEVWTMSQRSGLAVEEVLRHLKDSGLDSIPGTAAEILVDDVRRQICPNKLSTAEWIQVITTAHRIGIRTTATMMFGHIEGWPERIRHLEVIRNIQLETGGFTEFVMLPFVSFNTRLAHRYRLGPISLEEVLKVNAYSRLFFGKDLVNIQNSWVKIGVEGAIRSLSCGANDFGGTLMEENISRSAGADHGQFLTREEIEAAIRRAGRIPMERDTLYNLIGPSSART
ncbi:MAG: 5-amino-6-(D-ribitylamino)uracil--L-tyrosine 4-hydroxyphenyl transferase CofH [Chloroflexi bacterium]|nr:5-amino-6-(D-ribitylamino)uracil--L-tyrosine 4-hydroxyphenyl transferase CofH [Chloroflexota bacterium]